MKKLLKIFKKFLYFPLHATRYPLSLLHATRYTLPPVFKKLLHAIPYTLLPILLILLPTPYSLIPVNAMNIVNTKHNLSVSGPGPIKALSETRICVFCHTPHGGYSNDELGVAVPLWNHSLSQASYQLYQSQTLLSPTSPQIQPDGDSRLCLSCHDGTVAIGQVVNINGATTSISMSGTGSTGELPSTSSSYFGTNLSGHHPISIEVNDNLLTDKNTQCSEGLVTWKVCYPPVGQPVKLRPTHNKYGSGPYTSLGVQCTSCHDPHTDPTPGITMFLRLGDKDHTTDLCTKCHVDCNNTCP